MQIVVMVITAFIIAYTFDMGFFAAAMASVILWSVLWPVAAAALPHGQPLPGREETL